MKSSEPEDLQPWAILAWEERVHPNDAPSSFFMRNAWAFQTDHPKIHDEIEACAQSIAHESCGHLSRVEISGQTVAWIIRAHAWNGEREAKAHHAYAQVSFAALASWDRGPLTSHGLSTARQPWSIDELATLAEQAILSTNDAESDVPRTSRRAPSL